MAKKTLKSLKDFFIKFVSVVDSGDNPEAEVVMFKKKGGVKMKKLEEIMAELSKEDKGVVQTELDKIGTIADEKKALETTNDKLVKDNEKLKKAELVKEPIKDETDEELIKSADPKIQKILAEANKDAKEAKEVAEKLQKEKDEELAKARKVELKKEAEAYPNLGAPVEDIVEIFSKVDDDEKVKELIKGIFGAVNTALKDSKLIKTVGSDKDPDPKSVDEMVDEKAEELMKSDPKLTKEQAKTKVMKSDPNKYMEE